MGLFSKIINGLSRTRGKVGRFLGALNLQIGAAADDLDIERLLNELDVFVERAEQRYRCLHPINADQALKQLRHLHIHLYTHIH